MIHPLSAYELVRTMQDDRRTASHDALEPEPRLRKVAPVPDIEMGSPMERSPEAA